MKSIFLLIAFIALLASCKKETYNQLTDEDMKWMIYENNDMMRFQNNNGVIDTFIVYNKVKGYVVTGKKYDEYTSCSLYKTTDTLPGNTKGGLKVMRTSDGLFVSIRFPHHAQETFINHITPVAVDTINGIPYYNIYISQADTLNASWTEPVVQVWYGKDDGFIRFTDLYGNSWEILN